MIRTVGSVHGVSVNERTQCAHYHSDVDIVAIRFKCCDKFYACIHCHETIAGHEPVRWGRDEREAPAILCGNCHSILSVAEYLASGNTCPRCGALFNPGCAKHHHLYFEL
jgi:uncharacterized CHY-type Zn-finger protein